MSNKLSKLPRSFDARDWASEFVEIFNKLYPGVNIDEGWMLSWFANSLMSGYDEANRRMKKELESMKLKVESYKEENEGLIFYIKELEKEK